MKIPNFIDMQFVNSDGRLTNTWRDLLNQLFDQMQKNVSNEGFVIPSLDTLEIDSLTKAVDGTLIYDKSLNVLKIKQNGIFKTISTT